MKQKIAILGWGSLISRPRQLKSQQFSFNGPKLPIQFSRISRTGSVTLVKDFNHGVDVQTWSSLSNFDSLDLAIDNLRNREETKHDYIGFVDLIEMKYSTVYVTKTRIFVYKGYIIVDDEDIMFDQQLPDCVYESLKRIIKWTIESNYDATIWTDLPTNFSNKTRLEFNSTNLNLYLSTLPIEIKERSKDYILNIPFNVYYQLDGETLIRTLDN